MINTVSGPISEDDLGATLMHEHILVDLDGTNMIEKTYTTEEVVDIVLPFLIDVKNKGCSTIVEATPDGLGRDLEVLQECAKKSGLNIITCTGAWDGFSVRGKCVPKDIKEKTIDEIASIWVKETKEGIDGTGIKPGFIKMALGDEGEIFPLQEKLLRAAIKTSLETGLRIQCHVYQEPSVKRVFEILEEENLPFDNFIWVHADAKMDIPLILEVAKKGMWIEFDGIAGAENYEKYPPGIKKLLEENLIDQLLFGQDSGSFKIKENREENNIQNIRPYATFFDKFVPYCVKEGIDQELINKVITENTKRVLTLK
ncbi:MAG: phosphotriesterase family protein [Candidatus Heimdallarchaeota archaeon]